MHDSPNIFLSVALKKDLEKEASNLIYNYTAGKGNSSPKSVTEEDLLDDQLQGSAFMDQNYQEKSEKDQAKKGKKTDGQKVKSSTSKKSQDLEEMAKDDDATVNLEGSNRWKRKMEEERVNNEKEIGKLRAKVARLEEKLIESREAQKLEETRNLKLQKGKHSFSRVWHFNFFFIVLEFPELIRTAVTKGFQELNANFPAQPKLAYEKCASKPSGSVDKKRVQDLMV